MISFIFSASQMLILNPSRCKREGAEAKYAWRDAHWEEDLQMAYDAGRRMAES